MNQGNILINGTGGRLGGALNDHLAAHHPTIALQRRNLNRLSPEAIEKPYVVSISPMCSSPPP